MLVFSLSRNTCAVISKGWPTKPLGGWPDKTRLSSSASCQGSTTVAIYCDSLRVDALQCLGGTISGRHQKDVLAPKLSEQGQSELRTYFNNWPTSLVKRRPLQSFDLIYQFDTPPGGNWLAQLFCLPFRGDLDWIGS